MYLVRTPSGVVVQTPAKLNLFFEVLGKRPDGFHDIETLVVPIDCRDTLWLARRDDGRIHLTCIQARSCREAGLMDDVPGGPENLVVRAIELLRRRAGIEWGVDVRLVKRIPPAAGLGGGSSDAAAALAGVNALWSLGWSKPALAALGAELGSDVPLFFAPGAAVCRGRGEQVEPVAMRGPLHFVVVRPPQGLRTAAVYASCQPGQPPRSAARAQAALAAGNLGQLGRELFNRLEPAAESLCPWIGRLRSELAREDCLASRMTGSGTCCFGLCRHAGHARRVARRLQAKGWAMAWAVRASR